MSETEDPNNMVAVLLGLGDKLLTLPDGKFLAVLQTLSPAAEAAPVQALINEARPRLRILRPERTPSLKRLLCQSFEDLFEVTPTAGGAITRAVIAPLWQLLETQASQQLTSLNQAFRETGAGNPKRLAEIAGKTCALAAETLTAHMASWPDPESGALLLDVLQAAPEIDAFKRLFPRRFMPKLGKPEFDVLARHLEALSARRVPPQGYLVAIAARLIAPAQVLGWLRELGLAVPAALNQLAFDGAMGQIERVKQNAAEETAESFAEAAKQLLDALEALDDKLGPSWREALSRQAPEIGRVLQARLRTEILEAAQENILGVLTDGATTDQLRAAESHARALARVRVMARRLDLAQSAEAVITAIRTECIGRIDSLLAHPDAASARHMPAGVAQSIRLVEIVEGSAFARRTLEDARARIKKKTG